MRCSICGYAVDVLRSCYSSKWNFPDVGSIRGYYFFVPDSTPFYPGWNYFGSRNWHRGDGTDWPPYGELENTKQVWRNGGFSTTFPDLVTIGSADEIAGYAPCSGSPPGQLVAGLDLRCWRPPWAWDESGSAGGDELGGDADHWLGYLFSAAGGDVAGGSDSGIAGYFPLGLGGDVAGGSSDETIAFNGNAPAGGVLDGGGNPTQAHWSYVGLDGSVTGGTATNAHNP